MPENCGASAFPKVTSTYTVRELNEAINGVFSREPSCSLCTCKPWISIGNSYTCGSHLKCALHNVVFFFFSFLPNTTAFQSAVPYLLLSSIKTGTSVWCDHLSFMVQSFIAAFQLLCLGWGFVTQSESDQTLSLSSDP